MCGITGFITEDKNKKQIVKQMANAIKHRGPDGEGYYTDKVVALGHRRLSIIDLSTGDQPMFNEDKNLVIVFNGEIYNYKEIKKVLEKKNHKFNTNSDTEVILHGYEEYGNNIVKKLRGMFAFVIWDKETNELYGARDHFGIKPFYYYLKDNNFMFSSEIKSFLKHPKFEKELNDKVLPSYLSFNYVPTSETFFKNVYRLEPGHYFTFKDNELNIQKYFELTFDVKSRDMDSIINDISDIMTDSVKHHMLSDVEVGSFLSSGIDSSYIVALGKPNKTFTVGYDIPKYNEIDYAKDLANRLKIENKTYKISKEEYFNAVPNIMYHLDEPLADPAAIALYFVSKLASKDVKVVLSGEGADELFGGYNYYREEVDVSLYNKIPFCIRKLIANIASLFPEHRGLNFLVRRGQKLEDNYIGVTKVFSEKERNKVLITPTKERNKDITYDVFQSQKDQNNIIKMQAIDINFWLIKDIFQKADKMTMANSIEGRVPFTDIEVFNVARTLPFSAKVTKENTKVALRQAAKKVIPNESYNKKKLGFPVPLREWLKENDVVDAINKSFDTPISKKYFNNEKLHKMVNEHKINKRDNYKKIWTIYCFIIWYYEFFND